MKNAPLMDKLEDIVARLAESVARVAKRVTGLLGPDALLPRAPGVPYRRATESYEAARAALKAQIQAEQLKDIRVPWTHIAVDPRDGAVMTDETTALMVTEQAWGQLYGVLGTATGRGGKRELPETVGVRASSDACHRTVARSIAFADVQRASLRRSNADVVFRTYRPVKLGITGLWEVFRMSSSAEEGRAVRSVQSLRHGLTAFDDLAIIAVFDDFIDWKRPAYISRTVDHTYGTAHLPGHAKDGLLANVSFTNSETGCASWAFWAGATIRAVDAPVLLPGGTISADDAAIIHTRGRVEVQIASAHDSMRRRHTLRQREGGRLLSQEEREALGATLLRNGLELACKAAQELIGCWHDALSNFAEGWQGLAPDDVMMDAIEDRCAVTVEDRTALLTILADDARLAKLPRGSAAHICAAFAALAAQQTTVAESQRLQLLAGQWLVEGW